MSEWLANLEVGDTVIVSIGQGGSDCLTESSVGRLTKTLIFTKSGMRFRRKNGHAPDEWATSFLLEPTPKHMVLLRDSVLEGQRRNAACRLRKYEWHRLPLETLEAVEVLLRGESE